MRNRLRVKLSKMNFSISRKNGKILVMISQVFSELVKPVWNFSPYVETSLSNQQSSGGTDW